MQHLDYDILFSILFINWYPPRQMAYRIMASLNSKMMVNYQSLCFSQKHYLFEAQAETTAQTTEDIQGSNAMNMKWAETTRVPRVLNIGESSRADIQKFFERKIQIGTYTWAVGQDLNANLNPWTAMFADTAFKRKMDHYNLLKGKLMLTFYINGTPFHAGMLLASYKYLNLDNSEFNATSRVHLITRSQRPHVYLNPSTCKSGCLCVPFVFPGNFVGSTASHPFVTWLGSLDINSFNVLRQINAGADDIEISVFAQLMDVIVSGPTAGLFAQSEEFEAQSDEYASDGPVSAPASAIANVAGALESIPVIAPFATATRMAANAIGSIAKLFGYSKPIQIEPIKRVKNHPVSSMALVDDFDTSQKLSLTSKCELSIDPRLAEMSPDDVMSFRYLAQKESFVGNLAWTTLLNNGDYIGTVQVDPMAESRAVASGVTTIIPTALSYISRPMSAWSGTLRYRIQIIASQYHRGRFAIIYSPNINPPGSNEVFNTTYNMIIDLAEGRDFSFEVNWQQPSAYLPLNKTDSEDAFLSPTGRDVFATANGALYIQVLNKLTVPDGTTPVLLMISVSAGDDYEVVNPDGAELSNYVFAPQSEEFEAQSAVEETPPDENDPEATNHIQLTTGATEDITNKNLVYYGEAITSARQLAKRYSFVKRIGFPVTDSTKVNTYTIYLGGLPPEPGYDPNGYDRTFSEDSFTYAHVPFMIHYKRMFSAWKGAIRWKVVPVSGVKHMSASRFATPFNNTFRVETATAVDGNTSYSLAAEQGLYGNVYSPAGMALTQNRTMDALEYEIPYKSRWKFSRCDKEYGTNTENTELLTWPGGRGAMLRVVAEDNADFVVLELYAAAGEDFQLIGFLGAPRVFKYAFPGASLTN